MNTETDARYIKLYGERNTGTNYLHALITENLVAELLPGTVPMSLQQTYGDDEAVKDQYFLETFDQILGWKHAIPPESACLEKLGEFARRVLFITLTKNPYSWLLSLYRNPYHTGHAYHSFSDFLETPWKTVKRERAGAAYKNPVDLWNQKNASYLDLADYSECINLRYEDLLDDAKRILHQIAHNHTLAQKTELFRDIRQSTKGEHHKDHAYYRDYYLAERWRNDLNTRHIEQINALLDTDILGRLRYQLIQ